MNTSAQPTAAENISQAATKISRQNISNIVAKLRSGKTLSISEQKAMEKWEAETTDGEWVKDTSALAKELGLNRGAIYDARLKYGEEAPKKEKGSKRENLREWQKFCEGKLIGKDVSTQTLSDLKAELMREQIRLARAKNEREAGDVIDRDVVEAMLVTLGQKLDLLLRLKLEVELGPRVVGKNAAEANMEGGVMLEEIREVINANISQFETEALAQSRSVENQS